jgi:hypothetical protein
LQQRWRYPISTPVINQADITKIYKKKIQNVNTDETSNLCLISSLHPPQRGKEKDKPLIWEVLGVG